LAQSGLQDVVVADTETSRVDGLGGTLIVAGVPVGALGSFEEVAALLWGERPDAISAALGAGRRRAWPLVALADAALSRSDGMVALRGALSLLQREGPADIVGACAVLTAAWVRRHQGLAPLPPDPSLGHAADLQRMVLGAPHPARARALGAYLSTVAEHGMNASTFTARVVVSTGSDAVSAVVAALGALKGPLHGGAPGPVLDMLDAVGSPAGAPAWIAQELEAGRRIMGMGHRVYRVRDPRAAVLEAAVERLAEDVPQAGARLVLARAVEATAQAALAARTDRPLRANVEFYTAVLLDAIGLPRSAFTPLFACARTVGWLAHVAEQRAHGRMIRPRARYVGPLP